MNKFCLAAALLAVAPAGAANRDAAGDKKRAQLAHVQRIACVPVLYALRKAQPAAQAAKQGGDAAEYADLLHRLQQRASARLPERTGVRTGIAMIAAADVDAALASAKLAPADLFRDGGLMHGGKFPAPDPAVVQRLAAQLKADAVVLCALDEPRRENGHYYFDPIAGFGYASPHVVSHAAFYVTDAKGAEILHDFVEAMQPQTVRPGRKYLEEDWAQCNALAIEDFLDELTRYTPPLPPPVHPPPGHPPAATPAQSRQ